MRNRFKFLKEREEEVYGRYLTAQANILYLDTVLQGLKGKER